METIGIILYIPFLIIIDYYAKSTDPIYVRISMGIMVIYMAIFTHNTCTKLYNKIKTKYSI